MICFKETIPSRMLYVACFLGVLALTSAAHSLPAQSWLAVDRADIPSYMRLARLVGPANDAVSEEGMVTASPGGQVSWRITSPKTAFTSWGNAANPVSAQLPFDVICPDGIISAGANTILVAGSDSVSGAGYLSWLLLLGDAFSQRSIVVLATQQMPLIDPAGIAWDPVGNTLFCADGVSENLYAANWDGQSAPPASFQLAVTGASVSDDLLTSRIQPSPSGGLLVYPPEPLIGEPVWVRQQGGAWISSQGATILDGPNVELRCLDYLGGDYDAFIRAAEVGSFELLDESGAIVYSSSINVANSWASIPAWALQANGRYQVRFNGTLQHAVIRPVTRHSEPSSNVQNADGEVGRIHLSADGPYLGNQDFMVSSWVMADTASGSHTVSVYLGLGFNDPALPTTQVGLMTQMTGLEWIAGPWFHTLTSATPSQVVMYNHPITPASGAMVGMVPVYQWLMVTQTGAMVLSDVAGAPVF